MLLKRLFDILVSIVAILLLLPFLLLISVWIKLDSKGSILYLQNRVGKDNKEFKIFKFRTMHPDADKGGLLTVGGRDPRITRAGYFLRRYKFDEIPQLFNVLAGTMSFVGPRPEVRRYVNMYTAEQLKVLNVKPGITDYASIEYSNENELLAQSANPEEEYIKVVMPAKLKLNSRYIHEAGLLTDVKILWLTFTKVFFK